MDIHVLGQIINALTDRWAGIESAMFPATPSVIPPPTLPSP